MQPQHCADFGFAYKIVEFRRCCGEILTIQSVRIVFLSPGSSDMINLKVPSRRNLFGSTFLLEWLRAPLGVGAIAPSSSFLAKAMTSGLTKADAPIIELGPGTGAFTKALLQRGVSPSQISVIERGENFAAKLSLKFPDISVVQGDAADLIQLTPFEIGKVKVVICGLPLLSMPPSKVSRILEASFDCLELGGEFRLFTYGHKCPVSSEILSCLDLEACRLPIVLFNLPPATIYVLKKQKGSRLADRLLASQNKDDVEFKDKDLVD